jgi:2-polyprenyl-3-methyl-5-hydroxy-6-metoxy-1,4-benzoquinol methylase
MPAGLGASQEKDSGSSGDRDVATIRRPWGPERFFRRNSTIVRKLARRDLQPELMDQPGLADERHRKALDGLARVNWLSGASRPIWRRIRRTLDTAGVSGPISVCDIASGAGDVAAGLWRRAEREGVKLRITGYDVSRCAVEAAQSRADALGMEARFEVRDILACPLESLERFDVVTCSLFLHHLTEGQGVELLARMAQTSRRLAVVSDLERGRLGYVAARVVVRMVTRSDVVHYDGPQSVAAAFTVAEARRLTAAAGLTNVEVRRIWPFRFLLSWEHAG